MEITETATSDENPILPEEFPADKIETLIRNSLSDQAATQATLRGKSRTLGIGLQPAVDSLVAVGILAGLQEKMKLSLPPNLVKPGGYESVEEMVAEILPRLHDQWRAQHEGGCAS